MERIFQITAVVLAGIAAFFLWNGNREYAFAAIVLGCVSFFLAIRVQIKERNNIRDQERRQTSNDVAESD